MTDTKNDKPRFLTCSDSTGINRHMIETAWGATWCECDHTCIVNYGNNRGGVQLDEGDVPEWWRDALAAAFAKDPLGGGHDAAADFGTVWDNLVDLHDSIAAGQSTWDRWDEFSSYWNEAGLRLLESAGIAKIVVSHWDYQDGQGKWHGEDTGCGCTTVDFDLIPKRTFRVELRGHLHYHLDVEAVSLEEALAEADAAASEEGEKYLKTGELVDAWIDDAEEVSERTARTLKATGGQL